jgi:hypothetical protein
VSWRIIGNPAVEDSVAASVDDDGGVRATEGVGADVTPVPTTEAVQAASAMQERRNGSRATPRRRGRLDM